MAEKHRIEFCNARIIGQGAGNDNLFIDYNVEKYTADTTILTADNTIVTADNSAIIP